MTRGECYVVSVDDAQLLRNAMDVSSRVGQKKGSRSFGQLCKYFTRESSFDFMLGPMKSTRDKSHTVSPPSLLESRPDCSREIAMRITHSA